MYKIRGADQKEYGPVSADQIRQWIAQHRLNAQSMAQFEGEPDWKPLSQFPEFALALAAGPETAPVAPAPLPTLPTAAAAPVKTNAMAVTGFILGILSITGCICCYGFPCNIVGLILSIVGLNQINANPNTETGKGMAIAGIILSALGLLIGIGLLIAVMVFKVALPSEFKRL
jgi:hypothetical protein